MNETLHPSARRARAVAFLTMALLGCGPPGSGTQTCESCSADAKQGCAQGTLPLCIDVVAKQCEGLDGIQLANDGGDIIATCRSTSRSTWACVNEAVASACADANQCVGVRNGAIMCGACPTCEVSINGFGGLGAGPMTPAGSGPGPGTPGSPGEPKGPHAPKAPEDPKGPAQPGDAPKPDPMEDPEDPEPPGGCDVDRTGMAGSWNVVCWDDGSVFAE